MQTGKGQRCNQRFYSAIRINVNPATKFYNRGIAYGDKGELEKAVADYTDAIRLDPRLGAYAEKGDRYEAIVDFSEAIRLNPNYADTYCGRGRMYEKEGENLKAEADFIRARELGCAWSGSATLDD